MLIVLAGVPIAGAPAESPPIPRLWPGRTTFAVQAHIRRLNLPYFKRIAAGGFGAVRIPLVPWWAQNADGSWMWTNYDAMYEWLRKRDMTPLFVLQNPRSEADIESTLDFVRKAAVRYPFALLELGNEPDNPEQWPAFYPPRATSDLTPEAYWRIEDRYAAAWHERNPKARIATAGTSGMDVRWQRDLVEVLRKDRAFEDGRITAIGAHPYGEPLPPQRSRHGDVIADLRTLHDMLPSGVEVWLTEYGLIDPQPRDIDGWFTAMDALGVAVFSWYEIQDDVMNGETERYGLYNLDGSPKPAFEAARTYLQKRASP